MSLTSNKNKSKLWKKRKEKKNTRKRDNFLICLNEYSKSYTQYPKIQLEGRIIKEILKMDYTHISSKVSKLKEYNKLEIIL